MRPTPEFPPDLANVRLEPPRRSLASIAGRILLHLVYLAIALGAFLAYQHYSTIGAKTESTVSLIAAGFFALAPVRAVLHAFFAVERRVLHAVHGLGGLAIVGLSLSGAVQGRPILTHAALAPFAMMGAAQAMMHSTQPRNAAQAAALQRFVTSLPEIEQFTKGDLTSPANAQRAITVMNDLVSKAQALGETELAADPNFQSALSRVSTHVGLSLGLDALDQAIDTLAKNPAAASAIPDLKRRLAQARKTAGGA
ncbi:MAG TPA: hypothetical protein VJN96_17150 [Vicinamibacterales bacterium]|nr:hypothetical protein [Vicinamibacterales bacterium]